MLRLIAASALILLRATFCLAASSVEVLYVAEPQGNQYTLLTYNVNPKSAVATQVGQAVTINAASVDPLTVNGQHYIYVWNAADVWVYATNADGVPNSQPSQHLTFNFPQPVHNFLADPDGKFAYAALIWFDQSYNAYAAVQLFTIDPSNGNLSNTGETVASYGPSQYIPLTNFLFGTGGGKLFASWLDYGPHTSAIGYDYYPVNQTTGKMGALKSLFYAQTFECGTSCDVTVTNKVSAYSGVCCGPGSGSISVARNPNGPNFGCEYELAFCSDDTAGLYVDPVSQNLFFADQTVNQVYVAHIDFKNSQLVATTSSIAGTPPIFFSPDSRLVYAVNANAIGIYALQMTTGDFTASSSLADSGNVSIATATLK